MGRLEGKVAIITGANSGIGKATAERFALEGADLVLAARRLDKLKEVEAYAVAQGVRALSVATDVSQPEDCRRLVEAAVAAFDRIDILVNNAGNHCKKPIEDMEPADFSRVLQTHLVGSFALTRALLPQMRARKSGSVLFIASMTSYIGQPYVMGYSASKAGVLGMVHTLSAEVAADGVRVNAIAPGWIDTPMYRAATDNDPPRRAKILGRIQMNRVGEPSDIGWAAVYLCSDAAQYVTGVCLPVDGGALVGF